MKNILILFISFFSLYSGEVLSQEQEEAPQGITPVPEVQKTSETQKGPEAQKETPEAQEEAPTAQKETPETQKGPTAQEETPETQEEAPETQEGPTAQEETSETQKEPEIQEETLYSQSLYLFTAIHKEIQRELWYVYNSPPGPIFNTCRTRIGAIQCYWALFRLSNMTGQYLEETHAINNLFTMEGLEKENYHLTSSPDMDEGTASWFLLMTVEFIYWAIGNNLDLDEALKLLPIANTLANRIWPLLMSQTSWNLKGADRNRNLFLPFIVYALHQYLSVLAPFSEKGNVREILTALEEDVIKALFLYKNDGSQADQLRKTKICSSRTLGGVHRAYLEERGLLLPGYEEFERRTFQEDKKRIKNCEAEYETLFFSGAGPAHSPNVAFNYASMLVLLKKVGGDEFIRYFIRHNPISHKEFTLTEMKRNNHILIIGKEIIIPTLTDLYDDPEWQRDWKSIAKDYEQTIIPENFLSLVLSLFFSTEISLDMKLATK